MKTLRVLVVLLLAVLLPVRGAFAGAMPCEGAGAPHGGAMAHLQSPQGHEHHASHDPASPHDHASGHEHASHADAAVGHDGTTASPTCQFCASGCCMASIVASVPALGPAPFVATAAYPPLVVPDPAFESGGPERPPRTC